MFDVKAVEAEAAKEIAAENPTDYLGRTFVIGDRVVRGVTRYNNYSFVTETVSDVGHGFVRLEGRNQKLTRTDKLVIIT
jgi:hypothetical protein